jgi:alpha-beta hydrolase superfamily lysophospholipase
MRGTSNSGMAKRAEDEKKVKVVEHVSDVMRVLEVIKDENADSPLPIIVAHSIGGIITMKILESEVARNSLLGGAALLCSVPPSGNGPMTGRFLRRDLRKAFKIVQGFVFKKALTDIENARTLFFDSDKVSCTDEEVCYHMKKFEKDSKVSLDLADFAPILPSVTMDKISGGAAWLKEVKKETLSLKRCVLGAGEDYIVDEEGIEEVAKYMGVNKSMIDGAPHDVMLGGQWRKTADVLENWLESCI